MRNMQRKKFRNNSETYKKSLEERGYPGGIIHYSTAMLRHPSIPEMAKLKRQQHVWSIGDRYYKLAHEYYGDSRYWWVIAWFNKKPTESHLTIGEVLYIPSPLEEVLRYLGV